VVDEVEIIEIDASGCQLIAAGHGTEAAQHSVVAKKLAAFRRALAAHSAYDQKPSST
jgi:hypothetical protein